MKETADWAWGEGLASCKSSPQWRGTGKLLLERLVAMVIGSPRKTELMQGKSPMDLAWILAMSGISTFDILRVVAKPQTNWWI